MNCYFLDNYCDIIKTTVYIKRLFILGDSHEVCLSKEFNSKGAFKRT